MDMQNILEHYKSPENHGLLDDATDVVSVFNPLCGDKLTLSVKINEQGIIEKVGFEGQGCAISQATMSMLTEEILGEPLKTAQKRFTADDVIEMVGIDLTPTRTRCALISWDALQKIK